MTSIETETVMSSKAQAFWFLFLGVFFWSLMPLTVAVSGAGDRPFLFAAIFGLFSAVGLILYLVLFKRDCLHIELWKEFHDTLTGSGDDADRVSPAQEMSFWDRKVLWLTFIGRFEVLLFAWSTQFVDTAVATIIYEPDNP